MYLNSRTNKTFGRRRMAYRYQREFEPGFEKLILEDGDDFDRAAVEHLTLEVPPPQCTDLVFTRQNTNTLTSKLDSLIAEYNKSLVYFPEAGKCPENNVARVPDELLERLETALKDVSVCNLAVSEMLLIIAGLRKKAVDDEVELPRLFFNSLARVVDSVSDAERAQAIKASITKMLCTTVSTKDVQSLPEETLAVIPENGGISESGDPIYNAPDAIADTIVDAPNTIGLPDHNDFGNTMEINIEDMGTEAKVCDDPIYREAAEGLRQLFSVKNLLSPIGDLSLLEDQGSGDFIVKYIEESANGEITEVRDGNLVRNNDVKPLVVVKRTVARSSIDLEKGYLLQPQMWKAMDDGKSLFDLTNQDNVSVVNLRNGHALQMAEVLSLRSGLTNLWQKMKSMKLPSPAHINAGLEILKTGTALAGQVLNNSTLANAAQVMDAFQNGPLSSLSTWKKTEAQGGLYRLALNAIPNLVEIGEQSITGKAVSKDMLLRSAQGVAETIKGTFRQENETVAKIVLARTSARRRLKTVSRR